MKLSLNTVPARQGRRWLVQGWQVFQQAPLPLMAMLAGCLLISSVLTTAVPTLAPLVFALPPLVSLVYMLATHQVLQKRPVGLAVWQQAFTLTPQRTRAQLVICGANMGMVMAILALANWIDGGTMRGIFELANEMAKGSIEPAASQARLAALQSDPRYLQGLLFRGGALALMSVLFWHAPALVHWGGHSALKAIFASSVAVWINRWAFAVNSLLWFGLIVFSSMLMMILLGLIGLSALVLLMPMFLVMSTVFYCGLYFSFVDSFRFLPDESAPTDQR